MPNAESVSVGFWVPVGSRHEEQSQSGISHFIEHMLFKGTTRSSSRQISEAVEGVGGYLNAFTTEDHTCYYARAPKQYFQRVVRVLSEMMFDSVFAPSEVEREREVIREEIGMVRDEPQHYAQELGSAATWPAHPLGRPITGTAATVKGIRRAELMRFYRHAYRSDHLLLSVAGPQSADEAMRVVNGVEERRTRRVNGTGSIPAPRAWNRRRSTVRLSGVQDTGQSHAVLGFPTFGRRDPRRYALRIASVLLGENMSSRLFQEIRERRALCYSVHSSVMQLAETGALFVEFSLDPGNVDRATALVRKEMVRLATKGPSKAELRRAHEYLCGQISMGLEAPSGVMTWIGESVLSEGRILDPEETLRRILLVDQAGVREVASGLIGSSPGVGMVGPQLKLKDAWYDRMRLVA